MRDDDVAADPLAAWEPAGGAAWDADAAGHLLRRAGFRPSLGEIDAALALGPAATVDRLVAGEPVLVDAERSARAAALDRLARTLATGESVDRLRQWWLMRMCVTDAPLHARMTLVWHDHFAVSNSKVKSAPLMRGHLRTLETHALGDFGQLCRDLARDPAMIIWLDGNRNVNGRPNENFARELFELFMLGLGAYDEVDVREAARAFTGWHQRSGRFHFARHLHDEGEKSVLGRRGPLDGDDVIAAALARPACARFVAARLLRALVHPRPSDELVAAVAGRLREHAFDVGATVRDILRSRTFMGPAARRTIISSPAEHVVGLARSLEVMPDGPTLARAVTAAGQRLLEPPTVAGWPEQRGWLDPSRLLVRTDVARAASKAGAFDAGAFRRRHELDDAPAVIAAARRLTVSAGDGDAHADVATAAARAAEAGGRDLDRTLRAALDALVVLPEYQFI
jgi:uncharacterized protein (DUF1800 family)